MLHFKKILRRKRKMKIIVNELIKGLIKSPWYIILCIISILGIIATIKKIKK